MGSLRDKGLAQRRSTLRALRAAAGPVAGRFAIETLESRLHLSVSMLTSRITTPSANPVSITAVNGTGYFTTIDTSGANHLWKTDGTDAGTTQFLSYTGTGQSVPGGLTPSNGKLFYTASGNYAPGLGSSIHQLYVTDGTLAGTTQLTHYSFAGAGESNALDVNGTLFFLGNQGNYNNELWRSDGTPAGTVQLATWPMGSTGPVVRSLVNENGTLYFLANDATHGTELWKSDGTPAGTGMVADINPGTGNSTPANLTYVNGAVYFTANDGTHGTELWKTDGTAAGTTLVKDINPGAASSAPTSLTAYNGLLYFAGNDGVHGTELWQSDGTTAGTVMLADINPGAASSSLGNLLVAGGTLYLTADDGTHGFELWKTDGTAAGTTLVKDINPVLSATGGDGAGSAPTLLTNVNGKLFFSANDGTHGAELWASDGTAAGTRMVADADPGAAGSSIASPMAFGSQLVFIANDGTHGAELWASDGTAAGTTLLQDIYFGSTSSSPTGFANIGGKLLFAATSADTGNELWTTDGTSIGTYQVKNLTGTIIGMNPATLVPFGDRLIFQSGGRLWISDGTVAGSMQIGAGDIEAYANVGGELFFASNHNLWKTDGTAAGTTLVHTTDTNPTNTNFIDDFNAVNGRLYFRGYSSTAGNELWTSDGTAAGTYMVADQSPGTASTGIGTMIGIGASLFFGANALYKSDGTAIGTVPLATKFNSPTTYNFGTFTNLNGVLLFQVTGQLWRSDGTAAGTRQLTVGSIINQVLVGSAVVNGVEYFGAIDTSNNFGLWRSDGTDAGTYLVKSFGTTGGAESNFLAINGMLYFTAGAYSLWKSDGTAAGTSLVQAFPTNTSHGVEQLVNAAGSLYFLDNFRTYTTDGTPAGTVPADLSSPQPSMETVLAAVGDQTFLPGNTSQFGTQLWVITPPGVPSSPAAPATFSASAVSGGEIDLTWSAAANALAYQLQRSTDPAFGTTDFTVFVRDPLTTSYSDRTASPGVAYYYRIVADNRGGLSPYAAASASAPAAPIAPSGLTANPFPNHIDLSWTDNSANEGGFKIERSFYPDFTSIDTTFTVGPNVAAYSDVGVSPLNVYFYRVTAFNAAGPSGAATAVAFTPDLAPAQPIATRVSANEVDLQWVDASTTEVGFRVYRYPTSGGTPTLLSPLAVNTASFIDSSAAVNVAYSYFIEQYGPYGVSDSVSAACLSAAPVLSTSVAQLPGLSLPSGSGFPTAVVISNGIGFFAESDSRGFTDLWRTDGTAAGTTLVSATILGTLPLSTVGSSMVDMNGVLYFVGNDPGGGRGLCRSDGTAAGTYLLKDLNPSGNSTIHDLTVLNGVLYFRGSAATGTKDEALWKSDGTATGTVLVKDFGVLGATGLSYNQMISVNGKLLLSAASTADSNSLYQSDGTAAGTVQILPAAGPMNVENLKKVGNGAYFMNGNTFKLWFTDGTAAGTLEVPGSPALANTDDQFTDVGGQLFFAANGQTLWTSDGTAAGTHVVAALPQLIRPIAAFNGECVFATSGVTSSTVYATTGDPTSVSTIASITSDVNLAGISQLLVYGGNLYFSAEQSGRQWLLEETDGTPAGTSTVFTFHASNPPTNLSILGNLLLFAADDGYNGSQLWRSDGTAAGTSMVKNLDLTAMTAQPDWMTTVGDVVFFASSTSDIPNQTSGAAASGADTPMELWKTDGTAIGTTRLAFVAPSNLLGVGNTLYFSGFTVGAGTELWKSDGTAAGTVMVADISPGSASSGAMPLAGLGGILLFGVPVNTTGDYQLWRSDGTAAGTFQVSPALLHLYTKAENQPAPDFAVSNGVFYFVGNSAGAGDELWRSDGTAAGTSIVSDIVPGAVGSNPADLVDVNGALYFAAKDPVTATRDLYRSDGTPDGTVPVAAVGSNIQSITSVNGTVFFVGTDAAHGAELWSSTGGSTAIVSDIVAGVNGSLPFGLTAVGNALYFVAQTTSTGSTKYLFKSGGTAAGTVPIRPFVSYQAAPSYFTNVNGTLFYSDGLHLWSSDGTVGGTIQVMTTGSPLATPTLFAGPQAAVLGDKFIFGSFVTNLGRELRVAATTVPSAPSGLTVSSAGGSSFLNWNSSATNAVGYIVYRSTDPAFTTNLISAFVPAGPLSYTDSAAAPGTRYYYRVRAVNGAGMSAPSEVVSVLGATAPVVSAFSFAATPEGSPATVNGSFTGQAGDSFTATVNYGDGSGPQPLALNGFTFTLSHAYAEGGSYTVSVVVTDTTASLASAPATATAAISDATVQVSIGGAPATVPLGSGVNLTFTATNPNPLEMGPLIETWTITDAANNVVASGTGPSTTFTPTQAGTYTVTFSAGESSVPDAETGIATATLTVTQGAPNLASTVVGDGTAQRSVFNSLTLNFDQAVTLSAGAFTLNKVTTGTVDDGLGNTNSVTHPILTSTDVSAGLTYTKVGDGHQWIVSVTPGSGLDNGFGDFLDGVYQYTLHAAKITNSTGGALAGGDQTAAFLKRYGDIDGDGLVGNIDFGQFKTAFAKSAAATPVNTPNFDIDHDGSVGNIDFGRFKTNFSKPQQFLPS